MAKNILFPWSFPQSLPAAIFLVCGWVWVLFPLAGYAQAPSVAQADSLYRVGDYNAAAFAYRDLVRAWNSLDPDSASYYRVRAGKAFTQADNFSVAIPLFQQLLTATPPPPARIRAEAAVTLAHIYLLQREYTPGMKWVQQGLDLIATLVPPDTTVWAKACEQKAILYLYQDEPVAAHKWMTQAHDLRMAAFDSLHLETYKEKM